MYFNQVQNPKKVWSNTIHLFQQSINRVFLTWTLWKCSIEATEPEPKRTCFLRLRVSFLDRLKKNWTAEDRLYPPLKKKDKERWMVGNHHKYQEVCFRVNGLGARKNGLNWLFARLNFPKWPQGESVGTTQTHRVHGLLKWTRGWLPQIDYLNKPTFQINKAMLNSQTNTPAIPQVHHWQT